MKKWSGRKEKSDVRGNENEGRGLRTRKKIGSGVV